MRIIKFIIENYKSLKGRNEFKPAGSNFILVGPNGAGKTSAGRALIDIVTKNLPAVPLTEGEQSGFIEYTFDNGQKIQCKLSEGDAKVEFISPEGLKINSPKELWKKLSGDAMAFDIDEFLAMQPKPRRELLEKIVGLDLSEFSKKEKELEEERRQANAAAKAAQARLKKYDPKLALLPLLDTTQTLDKIQEMQDAINNFKKVQDGIVEREKRYKENSELINNLEIQIREIQAKNIKISDDLKKGGDWLNDNSAPSEQEISDLKSTLSQADAIKEAHRLAAEEQEWGKLKFEADTIEAKIHILRTEKSEAIKIAKLPAEGLEFDENGGILIDGFPFEDGQVSASRKLIAAIQISTSMLGEIRYLHFDGAALDKANADKIMEWADKNDLQLCIERPLWEGGDKVKMEIQDKTKVKDIETKQTKKKTEKLNESIAETFGATAVETNPKKLPWE
jgi:guanylate kinase